MNETIFSKIINEFKAIAILGCIGSGKTALAFKLLEYMNRPIYFIQHPKPELLEPLGYQNLYSFEDMAFVQDCVVVFDEVQLVDNYKRDIILSKILTLARHRNITLILSSADTRTFGARVEAFFDLWLIKDIDFATTKQRSILRGIIKRNCIIDPSGFRLPQDMVLVHARNYPKLYGKVKVDLPKGWNDKLSTPYRDDSSLQQTQSLEISVQKIDNTPQTTQPVKQESGDALSSKSTIAYDKEKLKTEEIKLIKNSFNS